MKKRLSKTEYIKNFLLHGDRASIKRCGFCKYYILNYEDIDMTARHFFADKCKHCIERFAYRKQKPPEWATDNFKPLYDWEPEKKE